MVTAESKEAIARVEERVKELDTPCELVNVVPLRQCLVETLLLPRDGAMVLGSERIEYGKILLPGLQDFWPDGVHQVLGLPGDNVLLVRGEGMQALLQFAELVKVLDQQLPPLGATSTGNCCGYTPMLHFGNTQEAVRLFPLLHRNASEVVTLLNSPGSAKQQSVLFAQVRKCLAIGDNAVLVRARNKEVMNELAEAIREFDTAYGTAEQPSASAHRKADPRTEAQAQPALEVMLVKIDAKDALNLFIEEGVVHTQNGEATIPMAELPPNLFPQYIDAAQLRKALGTLLTERKAKVLNAYRLIVPKDDQVYFRFSDGWGDTPNLWLGNIRFAKDGGISCYADRITLTMDTGFALRLSISPGKTAVLDWHTEKSEAGTITLLLLTPYQMTPGFRGMETLPPLF
jgi:hypothetical protein